MKALFVGGTGIISSASTSFNPGEYEVVRVWQNINFNVHQAQEI